MKKVHLDNGLSMFEVTSITDCFEINYNDVQKSLSQKFIVDGFYIAYLDYKISIGRFQGGNCLSLEGVDFQYLIKLRVFNEEQELFIWRNGLGFNGRFRKDGDNSKENNSKYVETDLVLFGTRHGKVIDNFSHIHEDRGTEIVLPEIDILKTIDDKKNRVKIKVRNYIGYTKNYQAEYIDSRFIKFTFGQNNIDLYKN